MAQYMHVTVLCKFAGEEVSDSVYTIYTRFQLGLSLISVSQLKLKLVDFSAFDVKNKDRVVVTLEN